MSQGKESFWDDAEVISVYSSDDAVDDGYLTACATLLPNLPPHVVSHVTCGVLALGYLDDDDQPNRANLIDLLNQAGPAIKLAVETGPDTSTVSISVETPNGNRVTVWAGFNEFGRLTLMLPSEY
jgi:hypothetical protein